MKPFMGALIVAIFCRGFAAFSDLVIPALMGVVIDEGIAYNDTQKIIWLCLLMLLIALGTLGLNLLGNFLATRSAQAMGESVRNATYEHIQKMTIRDVEKITTASLITRVTNDVEHVQRMMLMLSRFVIRAPITAIGGTVLSLLIDPWLTLIMFVGMVLLAVASISVYKVTRPIYRKVQHFIDRMTLVLRENLEGIRVIKAFGKAEYELDRFDTQSKKVRDNEMRAGKFNAFMGPSIALISNVILAAILYVSGFRVQSGDVMIGDVATIITYINMILHAMTMIPRMFMMFSRANTSAARISEVLDISDATVYGEESDPADPETILEFEHVNFAYPDTESRALHDISFRLRRGETMAVIGGTGSGKTTLLNLILRLYEPSSGRILFEGRDIAQYDKRTLTQRITAAMQQYNIFGMTIRENVMLDLDEDEEKLERSLESAQIMDLIDELEEGCDYRISQNGNNLSGGQKQRISVARTLYRKSDLVILDDVSSALDYRTDLKLRSALRKNYRGTSVILISQRISTVKGADNILVLDHGRVAGLAPHEELIETCETYRRICETQSVPVTKIS